jgi:hypothetical protein
VNTGAVYEPALDSWAPTSTAGIVPAARWCHTAVWTGGKMIVWGGLSNAIVRLDSGGVYDVGSGPLSYYRKN